MTDEDDITGRMIELADDEVRRLCRVIFQLFHSLGVDSRTGIITLGTAAGLAADMTETDREVVCRIVRAATLIPKAADGAPAAAAGN